MNIMNLWGEQDKRKIQEKLGLVLGLNLSFESIFQKTHFFFLKKKEKHPFPFYIYNYERCHKKQDSLFNITHTIYPAYITK